MIRRMITVSIRKLTQKDYDGISTVIGQIPLAYLRHPLRRAEAEMQK